MDSCTSISHNFLWQKTAMTKIKDFQYLTEARDQPAHPVCECPSPEITYICTKGCWCVNIAFILAFYAFTIIVLFAGREQN